MNSDTPAHDFLLPRLEALIEAAVAGGIARDVAVAVLADLVTGPPFNTAAADPRAGRQPAGQKNRHAERIAAPDGVP